LVSHNSDGEIRNCSQTLRILNDEKVEKVKDRISSFAKQIEKAKNILAA
jgi:Zn-finger protein